MNGWLFLCALFSSVAAKCNPNTGPSGTIECFQSSRYNNQYQWGTCLTDVYVKTKSNYRYACSDRSATYCYYQCMLELHEVLRGPVSDDCACKVGEQYTTSNLTLPSYCYSPSGTDCNWYEECFERRFKCSKTNDYFGMDFVTTFCNLYDKYDNDSSTEVKLWINSVRKCLQVSLVPMIRPWQYFTCNEVKTKAFASHVPCYVKPNPDSLEISLCNLGSSNLLNVFWTIRSSLLRTSSEAVNIFWNTMKKCSSIFYRNIFSRNDLRYVNLTFQITIHEPKRRRRSLTNPKAVSDLMVNRIADKLNWEKKGVIWFSDLENNALDTQHARKQESSINIFLANQNAYDLNAKNISYAAMNNTVLDFQKAVKDGALFETTDEFAYTVLAIKGCLDIECKSIQYEITSPKKEPNSSNETFAVIGVVSLVIVLFLVGVISKCRFSKLVKIF